MTGSLKISGLSFKAGKTTRRSNLFIPLKKITLFVGPNNSGKSLVLKEIEQYCYGNNPPRLIIQNIDFDFPASVAELETYLDPLVKQEQPNQPGRFVIQCYKIGRGNVNTTFTRNNLSSWINPIKKPTLLKGLITLYTLRLDGRSRFDYVKDQPIAGLGVPTQNHLHALFKNTVDREKARKLIYDAFDEYFLIDPTDLKTFKIKLSKTKPLKEIEYNFIKKTQWFENNTKSVSEYSDGVQSFIGLISALLSVQDKIILIDEPDAYLHPPLARKLGQALVGISQERDASLFAATHSADFIMGCLDVSTDVTIIRLTYHNNRATVRPLDSNSLTTLMRDPLLRSTGAIRALFHKSAVITEGDTDRAFYDEINRRLNQDNRGLDNSLFLNAQNNATVSRISGPLREIGVPAAIIIDLDSIKTGARVGFNKILSSCGVKQNDLAEIRTLKTQVLTALNGITLPQNAKAIKKGGITNLSGNDKINADKMINKLAEYGIFLVPQGELESWLSHLGIRGHGPKWLVPMFKILGRDPSDPTYIQSSCGNVWDFLDDISSWVNNLRRKGMS